LPKPKKQPYPLPLSEKRDLTAVEKTILLELAHADKSRKILEARAKVSRPTLHKHLTRLKREGKIVKSSDTSAWHITEAGSRAIGRFKIRDATKLNFVDGRQAGKPIPFLIVAGLAENVASSDLQALIRYRVETAFDRWIRDILGLAKAKRVIPEEYFNGKKHWGEITAIEWSRIQKEVLSDVRDVGYAEDVTPRDLIADLMKPEAREELRKISENNSYVPDLRSYLLEVSGQP
jgi:hypothetical protein